MTKAHVNVVRHPDWVFVYGGPSSVLHT